MRTNEMTAEQSAKALVRHERASEIIADFEKQHEYELPAPWKATVGTLLLRGLGDPELHLIFDTLQQVEYEAGRLAERPVKPWDFER